MPNCRIVVILPVYNGERGIGPRMLQESIESILSQTYRNFMLIIINDGSTDNTQNIISEYAAEDYRIRIFDTKRNFGVARALNIGINYASAFMAKYICIQGSDDWSKLNRLERQAEFLDFNPNIGMVGCWYEERDYMGNLQLTVNDLPRRPETIAQHLYSKHVCIGYPMIRWSVGQVLGWFDPLNFPKRASDYDFWLKVAEISEITIIPEVLYAARKCGDDYPNSLSYDRGEHLRALVKACELSEKRRQSCQAS